MSPGLPSAPRVVDAFALSPMQAGMLVQALRLAPASGTDIQQISMRLSEPLDPTLFVYAWRRLLDRHAILRTRLRWEGVEEPTQEVLDTVELTLTQVDWRGHEPEELRAHLVDRAVAERAQGFDLAVAPLLRVFVARIGEEEWAVLWTFHHVLLDGRSFPIVLQDLFDIYDGMRFRRTPALPEGVPFRHHVEHLAALDLSAAESHWRMALQGFSAPTPLGVEQAPPMAPEGLAVAGWGARQQHLTRQATRALGARASEAGVTVHTLLQAAWALLLHRYGGSRDIVFGSTRAGRQGLGEAARTAVGLFINTVPMRIAVDPAQRVDDWLAQIRTTQIELRGFDQAPLNKVQSWSEIDPGRSLFDSLLVYDHLSLGQRMRRLDRDWPHRSFDHVGQTGYPLTLVAYGDEQMLLRLEYDRARFTDRSMERMLGHLECVLQSLAAKQAERVGDLAWMTDVERADLIGDDVLQFGPGMPLHLQFEEQVRRTPQAPALTSVDGEGRRVEWSYAQLNAQANAVAHRLRAMGVQPNELVGLRTERQSALVVGLLGILKAGAAYLPLDPVYPQDRVAFMLADARVRLLLTQHSLSRDMQLPDTQQLCVEDLVEGSLTADDPTPVNSPDDLIYVIYTSGSTGQPKGVRITHANVSRLFTATQHWFGFDGRDVWTLFHSYAFDFSVWELWGALLHGGRLVTVTQELSRNIEAFHGLLRDERVTVLNQTPTAFRRLIDAVCQGQEQPLSLRYVIFGGEALELQMLRPWFERHGDERPQLVNMYGITETTVHVTYRPLRQQDLEDTSGSVIGVPIPDLKILLLDAQGDLVPVGVAGELVVCGAGLADGYLNRPELTAERFVPNRFAPQAGAWMYRSGDLARRLDDGDLEYLGRIDQQVKIRGFRIELGEIEAQIARHPRVRQVAVVARQDAPGDKRLAAYIVPDGDSAGLAAALREQLSTVLPDYMVPAHFIALEQLPLTPNGKLDQRALPVPQAVAAETLTAGRPPQTEVERQLAEIWASVLRVGQVGTDQHFFELGGDSILSIQIVARCRQAGLAVTLKDLFDHPTVAALASRLQTSAPTPVALHPAPAAEADAEPQALLTPIQRWFFDQQFAEAHHWNQSFLFEIPASWHGQALQQAWRSLLLRHPALTQTFCRGDNGGWQLGTPAAADASALKQVDLSACDDVRAHELIEERCGEAQGGLDFVHGPLARALHFDLGSARPARLLITIHHLAVDGVSWRILREDLQALILAAMNGSEAELPPPSASMARWSHALGRFAHGEAAAVSLPYWLRLAAQPSWILPAASRHGASQSAWVPDLVLSELQTRQLLQRVPARFGTQINAALLSALLRALQRLTSLEVMRVDLEGHGREPIDDSLDVSRTVGWFTSLYPVALRLPIGADAATALQTVHQQLQQVPDRGLSFGVLRWLCADPAVREPLAATAHAPLLFNYLGQFDAVTGPGSGFRFAAESPGPWRSPLAHRTHALEVVAQVRDGRMAFAWHHDALSVTVASVAAISEALSITLQELLATVTSTEAQSDLPSPAADAPDRPAVPELPADPASPLLQVPRDWLDLPALPRSPVRAQADRPAADEADFEPYALTAMQRLFFTMHEVRPELGLEQWQFRLEGALDTRQMRRALRTVIERHAMLRSRFFQASKGQPMQQVLPPARVADVPWVEIDLQGLSPQDQVRRLKEHVARDAQAPFDLERPPLMRVSLLRLAPQQWHFIWATHHLTLDGWSWPLLLSEWSRAYAALGAGADMPQPPALSFKTYVDWVSRPDAESVAFWRQQVERLRAPTPLTGSDASGSRAAVEQVMELEAGLTASITAHARQWRTTPGTVFNAAWALALSQACGQASVAYGITVSGRPAELEGVGTLIGPCVNNVPVCVDVERTATVGDWLAALGTRLRQIAQHQTMPLEAIQALSQVPWRQRLFDSLLVFQNYLIDDDARTMGPQVRNVLLAAPESTNYPLTLTVTMGERWRVRWLTHGAVLAAADLERLGEALLAALRTLVELAPATVGAWLDALPPHTRGWAMPASSVRSARNVPRPGGLTAREQAIAGLWCELFGVDQVGIDDNFFDIGGHSLLLIQAHRLMQERWGIEVPVVALLRHSTVRSLARHLDGNTESAAADNVARAAMARVQRLRAAQGRRPPPVHPGGAQ